MFKFVRSLKTEANIYLVCSTYTQFTIPFITDLWASNSYSVFPNCASST